MKKKKGPIATKEGRLYFTTEEFFNQETVQKLIKKLQASKLTQHIIKHTKSW